MKVRKKPLVRRVGVALLGAGMLAAAWLVRNIRQGLENHSRSAPEREER